MTTEKRVDTIEVNSFEEYTLYSLDQSSGAILGMMDRSKQIASQWPDLASMSCLPGLCKDVAALSSYQHSLNVAVGDFDGDAGGSWLRARDALQAVMNALQDSININDPDVIKQIFGFALPGALNDFMIAIPGLKQHVAGMISEVQPDVVAGNSEGV